MDLNQTLDTLTAIHSFCSNITKQEFLAVIGKETTWNKMTNNGAHHPNIFDLLSYADEPTKRKFGLWLQAKVKELKDQGFLGGK